MNKNREEAHKLESTTYLLYEQEKEYKLCLSKELSSFMQKNQENQILCMNKHPEQKIPHEREEIHFASDPEHTSRL
jgi:hypothetical protein